MKLAIVIWVCALISGITCTKYVDSTLNGLATLQGSNVQVQPAEALDLGNTVCLQACNEPSVQPASDYKVLLTNNEIR